MLVPLILAFAAANSDLAALGEQLFHDNRFSAPAGDMHTSCASCHLPADPQGDRAFTEFLSRSWHPWRAQDPTRETLRNTPLLLDVAHSPLIHFDGEFASLEDQVRATLTGRNFGWLPDEADAAVAHLAAVIRGGEDVGHYADRFKETFGIDAATATDSELLDAAARAVAGFMRGLGSPRNTPYDRFIAVNHLDDGPAADENPRDYAARLLAALDTRYQDGSLTMPPGFDGDALAGFKIFLRGSGPGVAGNCVSCHVPPFFTDFAFHDTGVEQETYDQFHGSGAFAALEIPLTGEGRGHNTRWMQAAAPGKPGLVDLGHWNFARPETSPLWREGDTPESFLSRTIAAFKTPTLRHLGSTAPYMHNGRYGTIEEVLDQKTRAGYFMRQGTLRNGDPELAAIRIDRDDAPALFAFLNALNGPNGRRLVPAGFADEHPAERPYSRYSGRDPALYGDR